MKKLNKVLWIGFAISLMAQTAGAQILANPGGRGLIHLSSAWNLEKGGLALNGYSASYFNNARVLGTDGGSSGLTYWDIQGALSIHYASGRHLELGLTQIVYQDNHKGSDEDGFNAPDDLLLELKVGSIGTETSNFKLGFNLGTRIPVADKHNLILEPYSSERVQAGFSTLFSYSPDPLIPESAFNLHVNMGFWYYNDTGINLVGGPGDQIAVVDPTTSFSYGIGFAFPVQHFDFSLEFTGLAYMNRPPVTAYGREDFMYLTPGVKYRPTQWISLMAGLDLRLSDFMDTSQYQAQGTALPRVNTELGNYPFWRMRTGVQFNLIKPAPQIPPSVELSRIANDGHNNKFQAKKNQLEEKLKERYELTKERLKTESAETELQRIRDERQRMEAIISRLKKILEVGDEAQPTQSEELTEKKP